MASSPPQGGTTAAICGSVSIAVSSPARSAAGALTTPSPLMHSPTTTSKPRSRSVRTQKSRRGRSPSATPLDGAVTPILSPGRSGRG